MEPRTTLSRQDLAGLRAVINTKYVTPKRDSVFQLEETMERALIVDASEMPTDIVTLDSRVLVRDLESGVCSAYTIVTPVLANAAQAYISVLAPLGVQLIGRRKGDTAMWDSSLGRRHLKIEAVMQSDGIPAGPPPRMRRDMQMHAQEPQHAYTRTAHSSADART